MSDLPLGALQEFCSGCGKPVEVGIPAGDNRPRYICRTCNTVHYENPKLVVGCVSEWDGKILLCKRAIEPRLGYWTVPAGFMELGESLAEGAERETMEEACAEISIDGLLAVVDTMQAGQVHVFFRGRLTNGTHAAGEESLDTRLFAPARNPLGRDCLQQRLYRAETLPGGPRNRSE